MLQGLLNYRLQGVPERPVPYRLTSLATVPKTALATAGVDYVVPVIRIVFVTRGICDDEARRRRRRRRRQHHDQDLDHDHAHSQQPQPRINFQLNAARACSALGRHMAEPCTHVKHG